MNILEFVQVGGVVSVVGIFIYYLEKKNAHAERMINRVVDGHKESMRDLNGTLEKISDQNANLAGTLDTHTREMGALMKVLDRLGR